MRRNRPGTKAKDMYSWPDQDFNDMETVLAGMNFCGKRCQKVGQVLSKIHFVLGIKLVC